MSATDPPPSDPVTRRELPPYRAVLVVDAKSFSANASAAQAALNTEIQRVLMSTFVRCGLAKEWEDRRFPGHTGDGYVLGLPPEHLPFLIDPLLGELQNTLRDRDRRRRAWEPPLRLRVSIHVGPLPDHGVGKPMTDTHRLLDSDQVRELLEQTHEDVTFVAAVVSARAYEDAVEGGYTDLHPSQFVAVRATTKRFDELAYLHVPQPSGPLLMVAVARGRDATPA